MQKARGHPKAPTACRHTVSGSLSVSQEYLALPDGAGIFTQRSSDSALLFVLFVFVYGTFTLYDGIFQ